MNTADYSYKVQDGKPSIESLEELLMKYQNDLLATGNFEAAVKIIQFGIQHLSLFFSDNYNNFLIASNGPYNQDFNYVYKFMTCYSNIWQFYAIALGNTNRLGSAENAAFMAGTILPVELPDANQTMQACEKIRSTVVHLSGNQLTKPIFNITSNFTELSDSVEQCMKNLNSIFR